VIKSYYLPKGKKERINSEEGKMTNTTTKNKHRKLLICIYTNGARNEFAIGLKEDENFRAMTKMGEFYTRFVDAFDEIEVDEKEIDWKQKLTKWIASAKGNEAIFTEVDLSGWNEVGERKELTR
jgi:phage-related protein